jgi:DNA-binding transcriptional LysR family regulator
MVMMRVFVRVAQRGAFAAAADDLRMSRAAVTKHVAALEARTGARLLDRTTRSVSITEAGRAYLERCIECLRAFDDAESAVGEFSRELRGVLRVAAPFDFVRHLRGVFGRLMKQHPALVLDVRFSNRTLDMVDAGIDAYVRVSNVVPAESVARRVATTTLAVWGSRTYFRKHGRPRTPAELAQHRFALFDEPPLIDEVVFERDGERTAVKMRPALVSNSGAATMFAVSEGAALAVLPSFLLPKNRDRIERCLGEWSAGERGVHVVYPARKFAPPKVHAIVALLLATLGPANRDPWL